MSDPNMFLHLADTPIAHEVKVDLTRNLKPFGLPADFTEFGGFLKSLKPLLFAVSGPLPSIIEEEWRELQCLTAYADLLPNWKGYVRQPFEGEFETLPTPAALCATVATPYAAQAILLQQLLLAVARKEGLRPETGLAWLTPRADQVRLACGYGAARERTLSALPAMPFGAAAVAHLEREVTRLLSPTSRGFDRLLLREIRKLCRALESAGVTRVPLEPPALESPPAPALHPDELSVVRLAPLEGVARMPRILEMPPGLSSDGSVTEPDCAIETEAGGPGEDVSRVQQQREEAFASYALAAAEDALPWSKASLDPVEWTRVHAHLATLDTAPGDPLERLFFGLRVATRLAVADLLALGLGPDADLTPDGKYRRRARLPDDAFLPKPEHADSYVDTHVEEFRVTLPAPVRRLLSATLQGRAGATLGDALGIEAEAAPDITETLGDRLRTLTGAPRLTERHLSRLLHDAIATATHDPVLTAIAAGPMDIRLPITAAYLSLSVSAIADAYAAAMAALFGPDDVPQKPVTEATVGSRCTLLLERLTLEVEALASGTETVIRDSARPLSERHNAFALYVAEVLRTSGIRPVNDFAAFPRAFGERHAVAEDKAPTERHARRPVVLAPLIRQQLKLYREHLASLARALLKAPETEPMGAAIIAMLTETYREGMLPFLFLLNAEGTEATGLSPSNLIAARPSWPYPDNVGRHLLATGLTVSGTPAYLRQLQLGHLAQGHVHLGESSLLTLEEVCDRLEGDLERCTADQGWVAIAGPLPARPLPVMPAGVVPYVHEALGPVDRKRTRIAKRERARTKVNEVLAMRSLAACVEQAEFEVIRADLVRRTHEDAEVREWAERLWWRFARTHQDPTRPLRPPPRFSCYAWPYPSIEREQPYFYGQAVAARTRLLDRFAARASSKRRATPAEHMAEILCSAALFSAFPDHAGLDKLRDLGPSDYVAVMGLVTRESTNGTQVLGRWAMDRFTAALIDRSPQMDPRPTKRDVYAELRSLLADIAPAVDRKDPLSALGALSRGLWRSWAPGTLWSYIDGTLPSTPLRRDTLKRVLGDHRLKISVEAELESEGAPAIVKVPGRPASLAKTREVYQRVCSIIREIRERRARGSAHSRVGETMEFLRRYEETFGALDAPLPGIAGALVGWAGHLARATSAKGPRLALSSILRYLSALDGLIDLAYDRDVAALTGDEFAGLYADLLDAAPRDGRPYIANRIVEFHDYLSWICPIEEPDWSFLPRSAMRRVDANLLSDREYRRCLDLLLSDGGSTDPQKLKQAALLILGYRFGLRAGECVRLRYADLTIEPKHIVVDVWSNFYGRTKSLAAHRRVPLIGELDAIEKKVLTDLKDAFETQVKRRDAIAGLFCDPEDPRAIITCRDLFERIHEAMRLVTGDLRLHFHHLRHGFGTRVMLGLVGDRFASKEVAALTQALFGYAPDHAALRKYLTREASCGPDCLRVLQKLLGHADLATSIGSYVHCMDLLLVAECDRQLDDVPVAAWAYVNGEDVETFRRRHNRAKREAATSGNIPDDHPPGFPRHVPAPEIPILRGKRAEKLSARELPPMTVNLVTVGDVLWELKSRDGDAHNTARRLTLPQALVLDIRRAATEYEEMGGYTAKSVRPVDGFFGGAPQDGKAPSTLDREHERLRSGLVTWDVLLKDKGPAVLETLRSGLNVRCKASGKIADLWVFDHVAAVKKFVVMLESLDIDLGSLVVTFRAQDLSEEAVAKQVTELERLGLEVIFKRTSSGPVRFSVSLKPGTKVFSYQGTLDRALEVLHIALLSGVSLGAPAPQQGVSPRGGARPRGAQGP